MCRSRTPPVNVARLLRQEAGFGCAVCGNPIVQYHHIIEWNERQHFEPEHMVVLCPNHHTEYGKLNRERSYRAKRNPFNIGRGLLTGYLGGKNAHRGVKFGGMECIDCDHAVTYCGIPIISLKNFEGESHVNFFFPADDFWPEVEIISNTATTWIDGFWDIEFKTNWLKLVKKDKSFIQLDFRHEFVELTGIFKLHSQKFELRDSYFKIDDSKICGGGASHSPVGLSLGGSRRILRPNFAMQEPKATFA